MRVSAASRLRSCGGAVEVPNTHAANPTGATTTDGVSLDTHEPSSRCSSRWAACTCGSRPGRSSLSDVVQFWQRLLSGACSARSQVRAARDLKRGTPTIGARTVAR